LDSTGKVTAKPADIKEHDDKNVDFIVKLPAEQAVFCKQTSTDRRSCGGKQSLKTSHTKKTMMSSMESTQYQHGSQGSMVQRAFSSRAVGQQCASRCSNVAHESSSDSQYSQSERSYSFTDSMEIAGFTSDSSLESFKGMYDGWL
jgi:hypothetical protein